MPALENLRDSDPDPDVVVAAEAAIARIQGSSPVSSSPVSEVGGIDLNEINVDRQGGGVEIYFDPVELQEIIDLGITGFVPVIINITPLPSVLPLLGLAPKEEEETEFELSSLN